MFYRSRAYGQRGGHCQAGECRADELSYSSSSNSDQPSGGSGALLAQVGSRRPWTNVPEPPEKPQASPASCQSFCFPAELDPGLGAGAVDLRRGVQLGVFAEFERAIIVERIDAGLARAKARGRVLGPPGITPSSIEDMRALRAQGHGLRVIADRLGVGRGTVEKYTKGIEAPWTQRAPSCHKSGVHLCARASTCRAQGATMKVRSFLQHGQVRRALDKVSVLARHPDVREAVSKLPRLLEQMPERMRRFYQGSAWVQASQARKSKREELTLVLDRITTRGLALKTGFNEAVQEQWRLDIMNWLNDGETLLRDNFPEQFRKLTVFAARVSPYSDRAKLEQVIAERLQVLSEIGKRRPRSSAPHEPSR